MSGWISVQKQVPEVKDGTESDFVLTYSGDAGMTEGFYCHEEAEWYDKDGELIDPYGDNEVTHWMPLPPPPETYQC